MSSDADLRHMGDGSEVLVVHVPLSFRRRGGRKRVIRSMQTDQPSVHRKPADPVLKALVRAHRWRQSIEDGTCASITELARAENVDRSYVGKVLRLTLLAPDLVEAVLDGAQPESMTLERLLSPFTSEWAAQRPEFVGNRLHSGPPM